MSLTIMGMKSLLLRDSVKVIVNKGGVCIPFNFNEDFPSRGLVFT
ncbi:unnamed protein product [Musa acuminata subsp. malaccensis]|nr:unnamed protein product [Musa acuminata subsp. malaccensis]